MKRALVAASVAALLLPLAWTTPAQAVSPCDSYLMDSVTGTKYSSPDEALKPEYTDEVGNYVS